MLFATYDMLTAHILAVFTAVFTCIRANKMMMMMMMMMMI